MSPRFQKPVPEHLRDPIEVDVPGLWNVNLLGLDIALLIGFVGGGLAPTGLLASLGVSFPGARWIPFVIGGVVGALLFAKVFTVALVFVSSLAGATVLTNTLFPAEGTGSFLFFALAAVGILVQGRKIFFGKKEREMD